jgi:16S rRNA (cytosine967-C5)-methyltransferase
LPRRPLHEPNGRSEALRILEELEKGRGHSNALLAHLPASLDERERGLATELVYGVLRRRSALDRCITRHASRPLQRIDAPLLNALRLTLHQILHLSRVPKAAAVNEGVRLVRARLGRAGAAFANAVLRSICRDLDERGIEPSDGVATDAAGLAGAHSFPEFLVERFLGRYGTKETIELLEVLNRPASMVLRVTGRASRMVDLIERLRGDGVEVISSPVLPGALRVARGVPQRSAPFRSGEIYIQDEASQLVTELLKPLRSGDEVVDVCAAPGGKTLAIADAMRTESRPPLATDISERRLQTLKENAGRAGIANLPCVVMDVRRPALAARFRRVLLDAPCSGTGIIRRHPEIRWRRTEEAIHQFARKQEEMLDAACGLVENGGRLVYAVCSLEPEEGSERIAALLEKRTDLIPIDARRCLPEAAHPLVNDRGFLETLPHRHDTDGFFAAVLERR